MKTRFAKVVMDAANRILGLSDNKGGVLNLVTSQLNASTGKLSMTANGETFNVKKTYTWTALQALTGMLHGDRAYVGNLGNTEFIYDSAQSAWVRNQAFVMSASAIPMVLPPSGSVGVNGALTLGGTGIISYGGSAAIAVDCYMYFPAGAVYSGSPANFYYVKMSSATAGIIYNNVFTAPTFGRPSIPAVPTPLATAAPGAFTSTIVGVSLFDIVIPGKLLGPNGQIRAMFTVDTKNTAGAKTIGTGYGGNVLFYSAIAGSQAYGFSSTMRNVNSRNRQVALYGSYGDIGSAGQNTYLSIDSNLDQDFVISAQIADPTDYVVLTGVTIEVISA